MTTAEILKNSEEAVKQQYRSFESTFKSVQVRDDGLGRVWNQKFLTNCKETYFAQKND